MATSRTPANQRQRTWRAQAAQPEQRARRRRVFRILLPTIGICLLGLLAWVLVLWFLRPPKLDLIAVAVADYRNPEVPPIPYCYEDLEALRQSLAVEDTRNSSLLGEASSEGMARLRTALEETSNSHDNVLIYIKAHGVSINGSAYLLGGDFELRGAAGRLLIDELLSDVEKSRAALKLLVLDAGHMDSDPRMGMITNEFTQLVTQAVASMPAKANVWVITSNSLFERAQVSLKDQRSALGYYLAEGLKGQADGILAVKNEKRNADGLIQLDELYTYVREHVIQYARLTSSDRQSQTPMLLHSGEGEVTDPPAADLTRIATSTADDKKEVALNFFHRRSAASPWSPGGLPALAIAAQAPAALEAKSPGSQGQPPAPSGSDAKAEGKTPDATKNDAAKPPAGDTKDAKTADAKDPSPSSKDDPKTKAKEVEAAKNSTPPPPQTAPRKRSTIEQSLYDYQTWLEDRQKGEQLWRPVDYSPDLSRLYYESLAGCRQRALAGRLFLNEPDYRSSLQQKLSELRTLQTKMDDRSVRFVNGLARPSYERDSDVKSAIRARNEACYLLPILVAHHARLSENTEPTMQRDLAGLISSTRDLDKLLAAQPGPSEAQRAFDGWKRQVVENTGRIRGHLSTLKTDFDDRCTKQKRNIEAEANQTVARALTDLAASPLANSQDCEELQDLAAKSARSFSEVEKQGSVRVRRPLGSEQQQWNELGWQRVRSRAELELELVTLGLSDPSDRKLKELHTALGKSSSFTDPAAAMGIARNIDEFLSSVYRRAPDRLRDQLATNRYDQWRAAETAIRMIDVRDEKRIEKELANRTARAWSDPIAGVPLQALPELTKSYRLVLGDSANSPAEPLTLNYQTPEKLIVRFESNIPLTDRLRLKLAYDDSRVDLRNSQGTELQPGKIWEFQAGDGSQNTTTEYRLELAIASRDERGDRSNLALTWIDADDRELARAAADLVHPEPQFVQLDVYGERFTAAAVNWQQAGKQWRFEAPFSSKGLAHVRLLPFPGNETHYDFRLINNVKNAKKYSAVVYAIPPADEADSNRSPDSLAMAAESTRKELARTDISIGPRGTASLPFFNAQPGAAGKEPAPGGAKAADDKGAAEKAPPVDVTSGMVCVLTDVTKPSDGKESAQPSRQVIVIEIDTQLPQNYITPRVNYTMRPGELGEIAVKLDPDIDRLPPGGSRVRLDVVTSVPGRFERPSGTKRETLITRQNLDGDTLREYVKSGAGRAQVLLHVDGYPRAFIYELPLEATLPNVVRKLGELHRVVLPDPKSFQLYYPGAPADPVAFPFSVDMPPSRDRTYLMRLFIDSQPGDETFRRGDTLVMESFQDRLHRVALIQQKDVSGMSLRSQVSDFTAMLDLHDVSDNQKVYVRAQLLRRDRGIESVLGTADDPADKTLVLYVDKQPPTLDAKGPTGIIYENEDFQIDLEAQDEVSGIKTVQFAAKLQANPDAKAIDEKILAEPMPVRRLTGDRFRLVHQFEKAGTQTLWFQATDMAGNKSELKPITISVSKVPAGTPAPTGPKAGKIAGRATLPDGARGEVKEVILSDAAGSVLKKTAPSADGSFVFDKLAPGQYTLDSKGVIGGNNSKPNPVKVTVEAGKTAAASLELGR